MELSKKVERLAEVLKNSNSNEEEIDKAISAYYEEINVTEDSSDVAKSMKKLSSLFNLENIKNGSMASLICGAIVESGYSSEYISNDFIEFFQKGIQNSMPFINECEEALKNNTNEEEDYELIERAKNTLENKHKESIKSLEGLDKYYQGGISLFSSSKKEFIKGKEALGSVSKYTSYNVSFYWFSKLFEVLYDEPIVVIDLITKKGIEGEISGIVDNFQLQLLLMGMPELNTNNLIPQEYLEVVKGIGIQQLEKTVSGKWDMCNWKYLRANSNENRNKRASEFWIWSEGTPDDIMKYKGSRIVLLDKPSYSRGLAIQRSFKNLKAEVKVLKILNEKEVEGLIEEFKN